MGGGGRREGEEGEQPSANNPHGVDRHSPGRDREETGLVNAASFRGLTR